MSIKNKAFRRVGGVIAAILVAVGALAPALTPLVSAAGQVQTRSIQISDSTPSQTGVKYNLTFTPATTGNHSFVIDFCSDGSIIGALCTAPSSFDAKTSVTMPTAPSGYNIDTSASFLSSRTNGIAVKDTAGTNNLGTGAVNFVFAGITNPSTTGSFWARIYTYSDNSYGSTGTAYTTPQALGSYVDYGGFAMSTVSLINVTATVMETMTFCVNKSSPGNGCTTLTTPVNLVLGHGSPRVLDSTQADSDFAHMQISTNAVGGAVIRAFTHNTCTGLSRDNGSTCPIPGLGGTGHDPFTTPNTAEFGLNVGTGSGGTGAITPHAPYSTTSEYAMQAAVASTYGDYIADTAGAPTANVDSTLTFAAQASVTTAAGVYSTAESLIATGTF